MTLSETLPKRYASLSTTNAGHANWVALTPIAFLSRTADVYGEQASLVYGHEQYTWQQTEARCQAIAQALRALDLQAFDTVSVLAFNTPETFEAHFSIPLAGGVINTINTRLDPATIAYILEQAESRFLLLDRALYPAAQLGIEACQKRGQALTVILIDDASVQNQPEVTCDYERYDSLLKKHHLERQNYLPYTIEDELAPLAINFTSGTSGLPKGVVYHHRGSYLMSMGTISGWALPRHPSYLYTVPLFHCNGWGHAWTMCAMAAKVVCVRTIVPDEIFTLLRNHRITHFGGAPTVLNMLANSPNAPTRIHPQETVQVMTAGAPPPAAVLAKMEAMGCDIMHVYGLTETYGHILQASPQPAWQSLDANAVAEHKACQGVRFPMTECVTVLDSNGQVVAHDGVSLGEIVVRSNTVMSGYLKDAEASQAVLKNGWFYSGDLAVIHPNGYIQVKDRAKDIIISGGENISSVEIENALYKHPAVSEAAVVAMPDDYWGESPCAFIELKPEQQISEQDLFAHCQAHLARFKCPKKIVFGPLPKTATGKIQKFQLRQQVRSTQTTQDLKNN